MHLPNIFDFLRSAESDATDLQVARGNEARKKNTDVSYDYDDLVDGLEREFGKGAVARGREVFAANCARCHSSVPESRGGSFQNRDFRALDDRTRLRADWLGNDQSTFVTEVGTYRCRALHSNHMAGHVWQEYGSETLRARPPDPNVQEASDGGRSYYRNISLLSLWAHAPFMHNNALGPELCGKPANPANEFYRSPYVASDKQPLPEGKAPACWAFDPSVEGRFKLYKASMQDLLNPAKRVPKISRFNEDVPLVFGPRLWDGAEERQVLGFTLTVPAGTSSGALGNFQHKTFVNDLVLTKLRADEVESKLVAQLGESEGKQTVAELREILAEVTRDPTQMIQSIRKRPHLLKVYSSCTADVENDGHRFGEGLAGSDKNALVAFLATM